MFYNKHYAAVDLRSRSLVVPDRWCVLCEIKWDNIRVVVLAHVCGLFFIIIIISSKHSIVSQSVIQRA